MKVTPTISTAEMVELLRKHLAERFGCEIGGIVIASYGKPRITISEDDMIEMCELRQRAAE